jgi:hypothetical protein
MTDAILIHQREGENKMDEKSLIAMMKIYENKLKEYMTEEEYTQFSEQVAKTVFLAEVLASPNDEFKKIVADNWDEITAPIDDGK